MTSRILLLSGLVCLAFNLPAMAQEATADATDKTPLEMKLPLKGSDESDKGYGILTPVPKGVLVKVEAQGLTPGWHAVHFHGKGTCADHDHGFQESGSHAARTGETHGFFSESGPHMGDLPNMFIQADGTGKAEFFTPFITEAELKDKDGAALMIHSQADDHKSQPAGNAGERVACGVVEAK